MFTKYVTSVLIVVGLAGCSVIKPKETTNLSDQNNTVVSLDFVNALSILNGHSPTNTMLQLRPAKTPFGDNLRIQLRNAGYGIQSIPDDESGPMLVTYQADSFENSTYKSIAYRMRVGSVELGREYEIRAGRIFPITALSVKGLEIASRPLDSTLFERTGIDTGKSQGKWIPVRPGSSRQTLIPAVDTTSLVQVMPHAVPENVSESRLEKEKPNYQAPKRIVEAGQRPHNNENMLILGESNFAHIFKEYQALKKDIVVFPNDSLFLGKDGKKQIAKLVDIFHEKTDLISIIGCSHGASTLEDGNKELALGRAKRVMDELLASSLPADRLYDEGCWAGYTQKDLPSRAVIITLRREAKQS